MHSGGCRPEMAAESGGGFRPAGKRPSHRADRVGIDAAERDHTRTRLLDTVTERGHPDVSRRQHRALRYAAPTRLMPSGYSVNA